MMMCSDGGFSRIYCQFTYFAQCLNVLVKRQCLLINDLNHVVSSRV